MCSYIKDADAEDFSKGIMSLGTYWIARIFFFSHFNLIFSFLIEHIKDSGDGRKFQSKKSAIVQGGWLRFWNFVAVSAFLSAGRKRYELPQLCNSTGIAYNGWWFKVVSEHLCASRYFQVTMAFVLNEVFHTTWHKTWKLQWQLCTSIPAIST